MLTQNLNLQNQALGSQKILELRGRWMWFGEMELWLGREDLTWVWCRRLGVSRDESAYSLAVIVLISGGIYCGLGREVELDRRGTISFLRSKEAEEGMAFESWWLSNLQLLGQGSLFIVPSYSEYFILFLYIFLSLIVSHFKSFLERVACKSNKIRLINT